MNGPKPPAERLLLSLGGMAVGLGLFAIVAWFGYAAFASQAIRATAAREPATGYGLAAYADAASIAELLLGAVAVALGWVVCDRGRGRELARRLGRTAIGLGVFALILLLLRV